MRGQASPTPYLISLVSPTPITHSPPRRERGESGPAKYTARALAKLSTWDTLRRNHSPRGTHPGPPGLGLHPTDDHRGPPEYVRPAHPSHPSLHPTFAHPVRANARPLIPPPPPQTHTHTVIPNAFAYRLVVGVIGLVVLGLVTFLVGLVVPTQNRPGNSTRLCTLLHCALTTVTACAAVAAAFWNILETPLYYAFCSASIALVQGIDGHLSWERYVIVHDPYEPTKLRTIAVYTFITTCLVLPLVMPMVLWVHDFSSSGGEFAGRMRVDSQVSFVYFTFLLYMLAIPAHLLWDIVLGCSVVTRTHELRLAIAMSAATTTTQQATGTHKEEEEQQQGAALVEMKHRTLLLVARKTITVRSGWVGGWLNCPSFLAFCFHSYILIHTVPGHLHAAEPLHPRAPRPLPVHLGLGRALQPHLRLR